MPIKRETPNSAIDDYIKEFLEERKQLIIKNLAYVGENCVNEARSYSGKQYKDQTGNLRSSTGYVVVSDGNIVQAGNFQQIKRGSEGTKDGESFARQIASQFPKGICLIVVAGMKYATNVSAKGYNVLDSAELLADKLVPQMLEQLGVNFNRK
ncbi:MAG: hypothetical protein LBI45_08820 [Bacteroidales bacterium]|jgi:hypothetical protein|nr:hypothetical protein [Bacteroidales bacterium]